MALKYDQLSRISISGYKSIKKCDIDFSKINVLIGSNGAGKSNFISAFALLQNILAENLQVFAGQSGINSLFYNGRKETDEIVFKIGFGEYLYGFTLIPTDDNRVIFSKELFGHESPDCSRANISAVSTVSTVPAGSSESLWKKGGLSRHEYIFLILEKQNWKVYHFHDTGRSARVKQEHNISNSKELFLDAANLAAFLYRLKNNYKTHYTEIVQTIQLIAPYFSDFILEPQEGNNEQIILKWQQKDCEDIFNASQLSDGTLRFICLATLLLQPDELQPATIIIDEPELGLHPYAITIFSEMVQQLSDEKQIIISTQSVEMLNEFDVEDVIVVDRSEKGSVFKRLDAKELELWLEDDYALGDLWKKNILGGRLSK